MDVNRGVENKDKNDEDSDGYSESSHATEKKSKMKSQQAKSVASSYRRLTKSSQRNFIWKYITCFVLSYPMINPILARHDRVNRFSRGLIHTT